MTKENPSSIYLRSVGESATEEIISIFPYRPLGFVTALLLRPFPITPNQVTIAKLVITLAGAVLTYFGLWTASAFILFFVIVLDHTDGQLARLKNLSSKLGRAIDDMTDYVTFASYYTAATLVLMREQGHFLYFIQGFVTGITAFFHTVVFDGTINSYLQPASPDASFLALERSRIEQTMRQTRKPFEKVACAVHLFHLKAQESSMRKGASQKPTVLFIRLCSLIGPMLNLTLLAVFLLMRKFGSLIYVTTIGLSLYAVVLFLLRDRINRLGAASSKGPDAACR